MTIPVGTLCYIVGRPKSLRRAPASHFGTVVKHGCHNVKGCCERGNAVCLLAVQGENFTRCVTTWSCLRPITPPPKGEGEPRHTLRLRKMGAPTLAEAAQRARDEALAL